MSITKTNPKIKVAIPSHRPHRDSFLPPDPEGMNDDRAVWAEYALTAFLSVTGCDRVDALSDLLANLRHWADRNGQNFETELARGLDHYQAETLPLPNGITPFDDYEIHGIREFNNGDHPFCEQVSDQDAQFWSLFGHIPDQGLECIGDFTSRQAAEIVLARIRGTS